MKKLLFSLFILSPLLVFSSIESNADKDENKALIHYIDWECEKLNYWMHLINQDYESIEPPHYYVFMQGQLKVYNEIKFILTLPQYANSKMKQSLPDSNISDNDFSFVDDED